MNTIKTKRCSKCGRELPTDNFYRDNRAKDGLYSWCKECHSKYYQTYKQTNKQYLNQYHRQYNQANKEYRKEYYQTNKEYLKEYQKQYNQTNKEYRNQYRNQFKGYYLYIILDKQDNVAYVGQTTNYYTRLINHLSGGVNSTKELFKSGDWHSIKYLDVSNFVENEAELRALENALIELYNPKLNTLKNIIRDIDKDRLFSLLSELHNMSNDWKIFKINQ